MSERTRAHVLDFDGVIFPRILYSIIPAPLQMEAFTPWKWNKPLELSHPRDTPVDRTVQHRELTKKEQRELQQHASRFVRPEMATILDDMQDADIFGNTGRPNHAQMVTMTENRLSEGKILDKFSGIFFKPDGMSSDESKYWGLEQIRGMGYKDIVYLDDNAGTVKRLAGLLPDVRFIIVQDLSSGLLFSRREMKEFPNVARVAIRKSGLVDITYASSAFGEFPFAVGRIGEL